MSTISKDQIWTSELNNLDVVQGGFDRSKTVQFYDTTLRDGEQSVGVCFTPQDKFEIACQLSEMGVSRIESGFPRVSPEDTEAVRKILAANLDAEIWGFARCVQGDLDAHVELGTEAVLMEVSTSDVKMEAYGFTRDSVLEKVGNSVSYALNNGIARVNFFAVDATRSDLDFLRQVYTTAIEAGATEVSVVDTIGACAPESAEHLIRTGRSWVGDDITIHWHGHNDFGLATASAIAAVRGGADFIQGTINGMGERAGNADICEVALALQCPVQRRRVAGPDQGEGNLTQGTTGRATTPWTAGSRWSASTCTPARAARWPTSSTCPRRSSPTRRTNRQRRPQDRAGQEERAVQHQTQAAGPRPGGAGRGQHADILNDVKVEATAAQTPADR